MNAKHLSDNEIQQYAFDASECEMDVIEHISSCPLCTKQVENYLLLSDAMSDLPEPALAFDLSHRVLTQLEKTSRTRSIFNYFIYTLIVLGSVVALTSLFYSTEILIDLFTSNSAITLSLIVSVALLVTSGLIVDMLRLHNKKLTLLNN